jgi:putative restriction endonuclease
VIRDLGIAANAQILGMAFQGPNAVREISEDASEKLRRHAFHQLSPSVADATPFDPETVNDARAKIMQTITARRGQKDFRDKLLTVYGGRCAITGCGIVDVLEAAHITPYLGPDTNHITNGLLLRADLHTLLDCGLLAIDPAKRTVILAKPLLDAADYKELAGRQLRDPEPISATPSPKAMEAQLKSSGIVR